MDDTVTRILAGVAAEMDRTALRKIFDPLARTQSSSSLSTAGLVINAGGSPLVKTGSATYYGLSKGIMNSKAAGTALPALVGTVLNATFNVFCFFMDSAGNLTSAAGTAGAALNKVVFPPFPRDQAMLGFVVINPTGTGSFVGGTTALDDATVVPNAAYISVIGSFDPTILV